MSNHTPGPWRYDYEPGFCGELLAPNGTNIAEFITEPNDSDARLIAAAPDLLAFVEEYMEAWEGGMAGDSYLARIARAAIAKATGEQT